MKQLTAIFLLLFLFGISSIFAGSKEKEKQYPTIEAIAERHFNGMNASDFFGYSVSDAGDVNGDGYADAIIGAYGYNSSTGRAYIFYGGATVDNSADVLLDGETTGDFFGYSVSSAGDVNGDGYDDVIVGAYNNDTGGTNIGRAYIFYGGSSMNNIADVTMTGATVFDYFGFSVSSAGDVNSDGYDDVIVGANGSDNGGSNIGNAYIYYGGTSMNSTADITMTGEVALDSFGFSVSTAGDVNGDGYDDVIVGANQNNSGGNDAGRAYIYYGGSTMNNIADVTMTGEAAGDNFGESVSSAGDVNGDGYNDVIVGAWRNDSGGSNAGRAYIYYGSSSMDNTADVTMTGEAANDNFGKSVSSAGDANGDGYDDVIVGAYLNDNSGAAAGKAYVFFGGSTMDNIVDIMSYGKVSGDFYARSVSSAGDMNGDGYDDFIVGAPNNDTNGGNAGRAYFYLNSLTGTDIYDLFMNGEAIGDWFGISVSSAGDVNGDGYDDVIVGAYNNDTGGTNIGRAYIYYGGPGMDFTADVTMTGEAAGDYFGRSVSTAGDVNGDGYDDVIVGAYNNDYGGSNAGRAYIYYGGSTMNSIADVTMTGEAANNGFGVSVSTAGDVNGDGYDDVIVGAYNNDFGGTGAGRAYIYYGGATMNSTADVTMTGETASDNFGISVSTAGDVNGDGYNDVIVGANGYNTTLDIGIGRAYIFYGGSSMNSTADVTMTGEAAFDNFGSSVSTAGDVNGDGYDDVIVGAYNNDYGGTDAGRAYIYYGGSTMNSTTDVTMTGDTSGDYFGVSVSTAGDVNGDGYDDVIVGAFYNDTGGNNAGRAYIYYGGSSMNNTADVTMTGEAAGDQFSQSVSSAGDVNGDGYDDVIVGANKNDSGGTDAGRSYVYFSSSPPIKPRLISAKDVPNDQGGNVKLKWIRSGYDADGFSNITGYKVQRSDPPNNSGYFWETVSTITPTHNKNYMYVAATMNDSTLNGSSTYYYRVIATTSSQNDYWVSNIESGRSVDNLSPGGVGNLANSNGSGGSVVLTWADNTEADLYNYQIYRSTEATIDPETETVYAAATEATYTDSNPPNGTINYFVRAVDVNGNAGVLSSTEASVILTTNIKVLLKGANAGSGTMTTFLNGGGYIPLNQPYSGSPWNYSGTESVASIPSGVVDWVLIELRTNTTTIAETRAAFLKSDGTLVDTDGTSPVNFPNSTTGNYYVVIKHRNHLSIMTANAVPLENSPPLYNMSTSQTNTYGTNPLEDLGSGYFGMFAGDANGNGQVQNNDNLDYWKAQNGQAGYKSGDFNLNGQVQNSDYQDYFKSNNGTGSQVPSGSKAFKRKTNEDK